MKYLRLLLLFFAVLSAGVLFALPVFAQSADFTLSVIPFADESTAVDWWYSFPEDRYYLFLPAGTDTSALRVTFSCDALKINGKKVKNGKTTGLLTPEEPLTVEAGGSSYPLTVLVSDRVPAVFIHTASGSLDAVHADKEYKEKGSFTAAENGVLTAVSEPLKYIKGRGNTTWDSSIGKKPYNIRFENRFDLFGMGAAKKWSLLANYFDSSLLRNTVALHAAQVLKIPYALDCRAADLYVNGEYLGNYLVCESVQVDPERVDIRDMEDENEKANAAVDVSAVESVYNDDPSVITRGTRKWVDLPNSLPVTESDFLLELDLPHKLQYEPAGFITDRGQCVIVKSPEHASKEQVEYLADLYQAFEDAVFSETGVNALGKSYLDYMDLPSFAASYVLLEYTMDVDFTVSSFFITVDGASGRLKAGPAWDFDVSFANFHEGKYNNRSLLFADVWSIYKNEMQDYSLFYHLALRPEFWEAASRCWLQNSSVFHDSFLQDAEGFLTDNLASGLMNGCRWNLLTGGTPAEKRDYYAKKAGRVSKFIAARADSLDRGFRDQDALGLYADLYDKIAAVENEPSEDDTAPAETALPGETQRETAPDEAVSGDREKNTRRIPAGIVSLAVGLPVLLTAVGLIVRSGKKKKRSDDDGENGREGADRRTVR